MNEPKAAVPGNALHAVSSVRLLVERRPRAVAYAVALAAVAVAFVLRWAIYGSLDNRLPFAFFLPAAMLAAWHGGLGPGLVAAAAGLLLGDYFFLPPHKAWGPLGEAERTAITIYAITATLAVTLFDHLHVRIRRLECELARRRRADGEPRTPD